MIDHLIFMLQVQDNYNFLFLMNYITFLFSHLSFKAHADRPVAWQQWHQDRRTAQIEGITDLNRDIHFFLAVILV
jgi:hypothetical protein